MATQRRTFLTILVLIGVTTAALIYLGTKTSVAGNQVPITRALQSAPLQIETSLAQEKVLQGSAGKVSVALTLTGADIVQPEREALQPVDLVIVLDRSGSMSGEKINDARRAVVQLINQMAADDRMAIVSYSNTVERLSPLVYLRGDQRDRLIRVVRQVFAGGGTNLGGGLQSGIDLFSQTEADNRQRRVILISDGLANQGITSPRALGAMAARATEKNLGVSTVGVGYDFNEVLMTTIADHGSGSYYFLENPAAFAEVFRQEFEAARNVVAGMVELRIPLQEGVKLTNAGGYPVSVKNGVAIIRPGDVLAGQQRRIFLTYQIPAEELGEYGLGNIQVSYHHQNELRHAAATKTLTVSCVQDEKEVVASIDKEVWSEQVLKEDFNNLREKVADAVREGRKDEALKVIEEYETQTDMINRSVGSTAVTENLQDELAPLRQSVEKTFAGAPSAVMEKRKQQAKSLQYESYRLRRDKK